MGRCRTAALIACLVLAANGPASARNDGSAEPDIALRAIHVFPSLDAARQACAGSSVVWADRHSGFWYGPADAGFGATKDGAYACLTDARGGNYWKFGAPPEMSGHPGRVFPFTPLFVGS